MNFTAGFHLLVPIARNGALSYLSLIHQFAERSGLFYENRRKELGSHRVQIKHRGGDTAKTRLWERIAKKFQSCGVVFYLLHSSA